jgi:hypothetical protein
MGRRDQPRRPIFFCPPSALPDRFVILCISFKETTLANDTTAALEHIPSLEEMRRQSEELGNRLATLRGRL